MFILVTCALGVAGSARFVVPLRTESGEKIQVFCLIFLSQSANTALMSK